MTDQGFKRLKDEILKELTVKIKEQINPLLALGVVLKNISPSNKHKTQMDELGRDWFGVMKSKEEEIERDGFGQVMKKKEEFERDGFGRRKKNLSIV